VPLLKIVDSYLRSRAPKIREPLARLAIKLGVLDGGMWRRRIADAVAAPDNAHIPRVPDAGKLVNGHQVMHNGLRIMPKSYYGLPIQMMLQVNRGVHEPQEERVFAEVLPHVRPGSVMIELGAYWGFYSMWFLREVKDGATYLVEPTDSGLASGRENFALNGLTGTFIQAYVGDAVGTHEDGTPVVTVDGLVAERGLDRVAILHADVQGAEVEMFRGASATLAAGKVDYVFVSTHSAELHKACREILVGYGFTILAAADLEETYSFDGLLVGRAVHLSEPGPVAIGLKGR
jgi:hypothetical protein